MVETSGALFAAHGQCAVSSGFLVDPRAPSAGTRSGIRLRRSKIKSKTFIRRPRASLAERSVGPGRVHTDERRLSAVARIEPTGPTRSGRPDDGLREIG